MKSKGFRFPKKFGFSASSGRVRPVAGYTRRVPAVRKAAGGPVTCAPGAVRQAAEAAVTRHVKADPPRGHGVKK